MEATAFATGLDPILTRGQKLVKRMSDEVISFEKDFTAWITRLHEETAALLPRSRSIIENDVTTLTGYLESAQKILDSVNQRLDRNPARQFGRAIGDSKECDTLAKLLSDAQELLRDVNKLVDPRLAIQESTPSQHLADSFRQYDPAGINVALDLEKKNCYGKPGTPEGYVREHLLEEPVRGPNIIAIHGMGGVPRATPGVPVATGGKASTAVERRIWKGDLRIEGESLAMVRSIVAIQNDLPNKARIRDTSGWPKRFVFDSKNIRSSMDVVKWVSAPGSEWLVRIATVDKNGVEIEDEKIAKVVNFIVDKKLVCEIKCNEGNGTPGILYIWGIPHQPHGHSLIGVFSPDESRAIAVD